MLKAIVLIYVLYGEVGAFVMRIYLLVAGMLRTDLFWWFI
jgi:hypothetical protein